jgi:1-acyl-sn-glycerol-3-phosphate acyltransferase
MYEKKVYKDHWFYGLLRYWVGNTFYGYFRKVEVNGFENLPADKPVILTPNHENGLVDALLVILASGEQPYSVARAGAFQNPTVHSILTFIKMFPAYRPRDGRENMHKNDEVFEKCADVLLSGKYLLMFPEGDQNMERRIRPLKKGVFRIAFNAEEQSNFNMDLQIVPVGIVYEDHFKIRRRVVINFGEPIGVDRLKGEYEENSARALNVIKKETFDGMEPLMMNIREKDHYSSVEFLRRMIIPVHLKNIGADTRRFSNFFSEDRALVDRLNPDSEGEDKLLQSIIKPLEELREFAKRKRVGAADLAEILSFPSLSMQLFLYVTLLPLFAVGFVTNFIPYSIPPFIARTKIKNAHFDATFRFGLSLLTFPIYYIIVWVIIGGFTNSVFYGFIGMMLVASLGIVSLEYLVEFRRTWRRMRVFLSSKGDKKMVRENLNLIYQKLEFR